LNERLGALHKPFAELRLTSKVEVRNHATLDSVDDPPGAGDDAPALICRMDIENPAIAGSWLPNYPAFSLESNQNLVRSLLGEGAGVGELRPG
jgi:hypothetical protein